VQVECGALKRQLVMFARSQAGVALNFVFYYQSVNDGLAVVEQGENAGIPSQSALHLHFVTAWFLFFSNICVLNI